MRSSPSLSVLSLSASMLLVAANARSDDSVAPSDAVGPDDNVAEEAPAPSDNASANQQTPATAAPASGATPSTSSAPRDESAQRTTARSLFEDGLQQAREGNFETSLRSFAKAYELAPHHTVLFNIGRAHEELGEEEAALAAYQRFLDTGRGLIDEKRRREVALRMADLRRAIAAQQAAARPALVSVSFDCPYPGFELKQGPRLVATTPIQGELVLPVGTPLRVVRDGYVAQVYEFETHDSGAPLVCKPQFSSLDGELPVSQLQVEGLPPGAVVLADGMRITEIDALPAGPHLLSFSAAGYFDDERYVDLTPGEDGTLSVSLQPIPPPPPKVQRPLRTAGITLSAVGLASFGTGVVVFLWNDNRYDTWRAQYAEVDALPADDPTRAGQEADSDALLSSIHSVDAVTWGLMATGGALITTGVTLWAWPSKQAEVDVALSPTGGVVRGRF